ncbi:MAG: SHOCT domain-containing protein [Prevotellaceae bacterium]|nr:SHOCT domain-containing protein [Prevotellaceae bacterium]
MKNIMGFASIISTMGSMLIYTTFVSQAVSNDDKAVVTAWIVIVANIVSLIGSFLVFGDSDYGMQNYGQDFAKLNMALKTYPYTMITSLISIAGMLYSAKDVRQKFKVVWWIAILAFAVAGCGALSLSMSIFNYNTYETCAIITLVISLVFMIMLFYIGKQEAEEQQWSDAVATTASNKEQSSKLDVTNKGQELMKLKELLDANIITQEEFDTEKRKILNS